MKIFSHFIGLLLTIFVTSNICAMYPANNRTRAIERAWSQAYRAASSGDIDFVQFMVILKNAIMEDLLSLEALPGKYAIMLYRLRTAHYLTIPNLYDTLIHNIRSDMWTNSQGSDVLYTQAYVDVVANIQDCYGRLIVAYENGDARIPKAS